MRSRQSLVSIPGIALFVGAVLLVSGCDLFVSTQGRIERAQGQIAARDYRGASIELKNALQADSENGLARRLLAEVSLQLGDAQGAEADMRRALTYGESAADVADLSARIKLALGQFAELLTAIDTGESLLTEPTKSLYRGRALHGLQRYQEALDEFENVLATDSTSIAGSIGAAEAEAGVGRFDAALQRIVGVTDRDPGNAYAWLVRGGLLASRGQYDAALTALDQAQKVDAGQLSAQQQAILLSSLVEVRLSRGDVAGAESAFRGLAQIVPNAPLTGLLRARIALIRQDYQGAAAELQRLVTASPSFVSARFLLGAVSLAQGRLQQADLHLSQVVQSSPENLEARKLLAQVRMRLDRPAEAVQVLVPALESGEFDPSVSTLLGAAQRQAGGSSQEISALETALTRSPDSTPLTLNLAAAYLREGEPRKALKLLDTTAASRGGIRRDALVVAALAAAEGSATADAELSRLLRNRPNDLDVLNLAAAFLIQRAEFDRGRALLVRALGQDPENAATLLMMARLEAATGNIDVAEAHLEKLISLDPDSTVALLGLAEIAARRGDLVGAIGRMETWRSRDPAATEPRFRLARLYLLSNQPEPAQKMLAEAIAASPDQAQANNVTGSIYMDLGRYEQAVASFRKSVESNGEQPAYWLSLAQAQLALDQRPAARETLERALALQPDSVPAVGMLALLDLREGNRERALGRVRELRQKRPRDSAVHVLEGDVLLATRQYQEATTAFDAAFALRPEASSAIKSYRARYQGRLGEVTDPLTRWLARNPADTSVRLVLAEAYQLGDQPKRAIQEYEIALRDGLPSPMVLNNLAWLYHTEGDPRAVATAQRAYTLAPKAAPVADTYGWILVQNGRAQEGLPLLEQAVKGAPDDAEIKYHHAAALGRSGRAAEARRALGDLLDGKADFPSRSDAARMLKELEGR